MAKVAVDLGYGYVKAVSEHGKRIVFPALVAAVGPDRDNSLSVLGSAQNNRIQIRDGRRVKAFVVGESALNHPHTVRAWDLGEEHSLHENSQVLLCKALATLLDDLNEPCRLVVGLPLNLFASHQRAVSEYLSALTAEMAVDNGDFRRLTIVPPVTVLPQAAGAFFHALLNVNGSIKEPTLLTANTGIIDVGYRTVDYLFMARTGGGAPVSQPELSGTFDRGMGWVYQHVRQAVMTRLGRPVDLKTIETAFVWNQGLLKYRGQPLDLEVDAEEARELLAVELAAKIKRVWGETVDFADHVILTGGGGQALYPHLKDKLPVRLGEDCVFANALGYLAGLNYRERQATNIR